jgi:DNA-3-methyladenine glycosylase II
MSTAPHMAARRHLAKRSAELNELMARVGPCKLKPRDDEPFSLLVNCVVSQQISTLAAKAIFGKLAAAAGGPPILPKKLAALTPEQLRACGLSAPKQRTIANVLQFQAENPKFLPKIKDYSNEAIAEKLTTISGIGPWSVDMLLLFGLGRPDVWPVGDYGIRVAVQRLFALDALPSPARLHELADTWTPYRSVAAWYLWRSLDSKASA